MRVQAALVCTVLACSFAVAAHADPYVLFNLNGTLPNGGTAAGTVILDTTKGYLLNNNIVVQEGGFSYTFIGSFFEGNYMNGSINDLYSTSYDRAGDGLTLVFPQALLIGYTGGPLCTVNVAPCGSFLSSFSMGMSQQGFTSLGVTSPTPEPGTLGLLGTGVLGVAGLVLRRYARA